MIRAGVIGYKGHATRIISRLEKYSGPDLELTHIYHPTKRILRVAGSVHLDEPRSTNNFEDLKDCDVIFILSPNETHGHYLSLARELGDKYIFCEKPPFSSQEELDRFCDPDGKTFFNFNFRRSALASWIHGAKKVIGSPLHANVNLTHGLAFKDGYAESWRADVAKHPLGVIETVGVHWIDLLASEFGEVGDVQVVASIESGRGTAYDTASLRLQHEGGMTSDVFVSYAAAYNFDFVIQGTDGTFRYDRQTGPYEAGNFNTFYPRDSFDPYGNFVRPPIMEYVPGNLEEVYEDSLEMSLVTFLEVCHMGGRMDDEEYRAAIRTNQLLLDVRSNLEL